MRSLFSPVLSFLFSSVSLKANLSLSPRLQAKQNIFPVPGGVKAKKTAGKKLKKKKKQRFALGSPTPLPRTYFFRDRRYTSDGRPVGELPKSFVKSLFQHFLGPGVKLAPDAMEEVMNASVPPPFPSLCFFDIGRC